MTTQIACKDMPRAPQRPPLSVLVVIVMLAAARHPTMTAAAAPAITIDAAATGAPISKYIYGQFIEHLGRCIDGGIWSEMLADRKFFAPVGDKNSPWQALGSAECVTMDRSESFVGDQTPKITLPGDGKPAGIGQEGLGLVAGKAYTGHIYLAGDSQIGPIDVSLIWDNRPEQRQTISIDGIGTGYALTPLRFVARATTDSGHHARTPPGRGSNIMTLASTNSSPSAAKFSRNLISPSIADSEVLQRRSRKSTTPTPRRRRRWASCGPAMATLSRTR